MSEKIELTENNTKFSSGKFGKEAKTSDVFNFLMPKRMFPVSLRWFDPLRQIYVLEYPPTHRIIHKHRNGDPFRIPVPWQVYICSTQPRDVKFFCRTQQLTSLDDMLYHQFLPNVYRSATPCSGAQGVLQKDPIDDCRGMIDALWMTTFSGGAYISSHGPKGGAFNDPGGSLMPGDIVKAGFDESFWAYDSKGWHKWMETKSIEDVLSWEWKQAGSVLDLIEFTAGEQKSPWNGFKSAFGRDIPAKSVQTK